MSFGSDELLYVTEWADSGDGDRVSVYDMYGNYLAIVANKGAGNGQIEDASFVFDNKGNLWAADRYSRVQRLIKCGTILTPTPAPIEGIEACYRPAEIISIPGSAAKPDGILIDSAGVYVYMSRCFLNDVSRINMSTRAVEAIISTEFNCPGQIASGTDGKIYIADKGNNAIKILGNGGAYIGMIDGGAAGVAGFSAPMGLDVYEDEIYLSDADSDMIKVFNGSGEYIRGWGGYGIADGYFKGLGPLAAREGEVFAADRHNKRIQVFNKEGVFLRFWETDYDDIRDIKISPDGTVFINGITDGIGVIDGFSEEGVRLMRVGHEGSSGIAVNTERIITGAADGYGLQAYMPCAMVTPSVVHPWPKPDLVVISVAVTGMMGNWQAL